MFKLQFLLFTFLVPSEFYFVFGSLELPIYRIVMVILFPIVVRDLIKKKAFRWFTCDYAALCVCTWPSIAYIANTGILTAIESGGVLFLELFVPYFLTRTTIDSYSKLKKLSKTLFLITALLCIVGIPEAITGTYYVHYYASLVTGTPYLLSPDSRLGIYRAIGPTDHAIIFGTICASTLAIAINMSKRQVKYYGAIILSLIGVLISASSGPLLSCLSQTALLIWSRLLKGNSQKWAILCICILFLYILVDMLSNRGPFQVMFSYLLFNTHNGYMRYYMWQNSIDLANHSVVSALFGYGNSNEMFALIEVEHIKRLMESTVDSYWLINLIRYGWTMLIIHAIFVGLALKRGYRQIYKNGPYKEKKLIEAWFISLIAVSLIAFTVHFWGHVASLYMIIIASFIGVKITPHKTALITDTQSNQT